MKNHFETQAIHTVYSKYDPYGSLQFPVYETNAFEFATAEAMADAFTGKTAEYTYSRISNPTVGYLEKRVAEITGAFGVTAFNSGMAAISNLLLNIAYSGANIVTSPHLFGNTYSLFASTFKAFGVEARFCDLTNITDVSNAIDGNTCAVFLEIVTNPQLEIADLTALSILTRQMNVPLVADTTAVPFCAFKAKEFGIDIEVVSSTKYISAGATSLGGLIIDYGSFDWISNRNFKDYESSGKGAFTARLRKEIHRNIGAYMIPHVAHTQLLGLETLSLRFAKVTASCLNIAGELQLISQVQAVNYPGLPTSPFHHLAKKQFGGLPGAMLTFDLASKDACFAFLNRLKLIKRSTNLFDNKSLIIHPASTIFGTFSQEIRNRMNLSDCTIRLSVGLEDVADIKDDIRQALE